ncbi:MAG: InlB B-repeat-containing protein [Bacteroidales bacterium]|nr:InlB B-repeat-containing protein [Bacteroidales bacterium]
MRKLLFYFLIVSALFVVSSCGDDDNDDPKTYTVMFDTDGGPEIAYQIVEEGKTAQMPQEPVKDGFKFQGWFVGDSQFYFSTPITADITLKAQWVEDEYPPLPGGEFKYVNNIFSVSANRKVYFAAGNLQYNPRDMVWRFAEHQYDRIGTDNVNFSSDNRWIDLFPWGIGARLSFIYSVADKDNYSVFTDWGTLIGEDNTWFTLSIDEWKYLIAGRDNAAQKYGIGVVDGYPSGLILLPDDWQIPDDLEFYSGFAKDYGYDSFRQRNSYSKEEWRKMENAGAVFLPAAGFRDGASVYNVGDNGRYWSCTAFDAELSCVMLFGSTNVFSEYDGRFYGMSVRLVREP